MPLVHMGDMLRHAYQNSYAVPAFNVLSLDFLTGIISAAEVKHAPVIISLAASHFNFFDFDLLMSAVVKASRRATVPVAIHLDHGHTINSAINAINQGCTGIMIDTSNLALEDNIRESKATVDMAHACGIPVEGKLDYVTGVEDDDAKKHSGKVVFTTISDAKRYLDETGVDFLAVSIGSVYGRMTAIPSLDINRLQDINQTLQIPLVIHGEAGLSDLQFQQLIDNGVSKINYYTALADAARHCIQDNVRHSNSESYTSMFKGVSGAISLEAERCIDILGSAGKAEELLTFCRPWKQVAHVIIYNTENLDTNGVEDMKAEGRRVLSAIPGATEVFTGHAIQEDSQYKHCWVIHFTDRSVIESYKYHPDHQQFADECFRPYAGGRVSIDYEDSSSNKK